MTLVTDPDDLDRFQVVVDPTNEEISIRGHGTIRTTKRTDGDVVNATTLDAAGADFVTDGVIAGDILTIVSGTNIGHYTVASVTDLNTLVINETFPDTGEAAGQTFRINQATPVAGPQGGTVGDGVTLQALYSFLKEEWRTFDTGLFSAGEAPDLINFIFPLESITREQFEIGGSTHSNWDFKDDTTRQLIRTGGWQQINSSGVVQADYTGVITLGSLDSDAQVYFTQAAAGPGSTPTNFVLTGPVNQAIKTFTNGGDNFRTFLKLFVRKKARTYAGSEIADIGVTTIETIVNRFPLAHDPDPAILLTDGEIAGDPANVAFQAVTTVDSAKTDGVSADADTTDGLFEFTSATSLFQTTNKVRVGDTVEITSATDQGHYEIQAVSSETALVLFQEPGVAIVGGSSLAFTTRTRVRNDGASDGVSADAVADDEEGEFTSATVGDFAAAGVVAGDMLLISSATTGSLEGIYKIKSVATTTLTVNIEDNENWATEGSITFIIYEKGMWLQFKDETITLGATGDLTFADADPDTITRASGNWTTDGVLPGDIITITGSTNNNGNYTAATVGTTVLTLVATDTLTAEGPVGATATCKRGFTRTLNGVEYGFKWRQFGNGGTLAECFQWIQRALRRTTDIDSAEATSRGDITDLLQAFASPNTTTTNLIIDDVAAADLNNLTSGDATGVNRNFAFLSSITINISQTLIDATSSKVSVFWTDSPNEFGTVGALLVQDNVAADMESLNPASSPVTFTYDYDASQNGHGGGADENITIVAIGTDFAQYALVTGTITKINNNVFSITSALERNYSNP